MDEERRKSKMKLHLSKIWPRILPPHPWQFSLPTVFTIGQNAICIYISFFIRSRPPNIKNVAEMWQTIWNRRVDSTFFPLTFCGVCTAMFIDNGPCSELSSMSVGRWWYWNCTHQYSELRIKHYSDGREGFVHTYQSLHKTVAFECLPSFHLWFLPNKNLATWAPEWCNRSVHLIIRKLRVLCEFLMIQPSMAESPGEQDSTFLQVMVRHPVTPDEQDSSSWRTHVSFFHPVLVEYDRGELGWWVGICQDKITPRWFA